MRVLLITRDIFSQENSGGVFVSKQFYNMLISIFGEDEIDIFTISKPSTKLLLRNLIFNESYGQTNENFSELKKKLQFSYSLIIFNGSIYGGFVKYCSKKSNCPILVYYHNVETIFYKEKSCFDRTLSSFLYSKFIKKNEKLSTIYASYRVLLNERDSDVLYKIFRRNADLIIPISLPEVSVSINNQPIIEKSFCLFVGSDFFANVEGISWFIDNVLPSIEIELWIVGSVCKSLTKYVNISNLKLCGYVDNLASYYNNALFVVSPIFSGSGMKTKTIEALSYGKNIIGTDEAFVGISSDINNIGYLCNDTDSFISAINGFSRNSYNESSLKLFMEKYSLSNCTNKLREFLNRRLK